MHRWASSFLPVLMSPATVGLSTLLVIGLALANIQRVREWAEAWQVEQEVLSHAPLHKIRNVARLTALGPEPRGPHGAAAR